MGAWQEIADYTVPSNTTSVTLNNFGTITKDDFIKINITTSSGASGFLSLLGNSSSSSNYHLQDLFANGSSISAARVNANQLNSSSGQSNIFVLAKLSENDRLNIFSNQVVDTSSVYGGFKYITSSGATFSSGITSFTVTASVTNGITTGSRIQIYKLAAEKVADITLASNTTQVDISNLSIDKDSEYLLMSDIVNAQSLYMDTFITPNDLTTNTQYYRQTILGNNSSASAARSNEPRSIEIEGNKIGVAYTHIKVSNIGAFTSQNYTISGAGSTTPFVWNHFVSSTYENLTTITKLNIRVNRTNGIGSGTRFILYKLY